jgi:tetratricopeptide (TPR) repeat protein
LRYRLVDRFDDFITMKWVSRIFGTSGLFSWVGKFSRQVKSGRLRNGLLGIPAIAVLVLCGYVYAARFSSDRVAAEQYWKKAQSAIAKKDSKTAELCLRRVLSEQSAFEEKAQYMLAVLLEDSGQTQRAETLFRRLAPDDRIGTPAAHRRLAIILSESLTPKSSAEEIERVHWHLKAARDEKSPAMALCWGRHYAMVGDIKRATDFFRVASREYPELFQAIGDFETRLGNSKEAASSFSRARTFLASRVSSDPDNALAKVNYAQVLMKLGEFDDARTVLLSGKKAKRDDEIQWDTLLSSLYVNYHDLISQRGAGIGELLEKLENALRYDPNSQAALQRLMAYSEAEVNGDIGLKRILARVIAEGKTPAMSHLAMGNLCSLEGERKQAKFHFERALSMEKDLAVVMNNMAWLLAHDEQPDYDRALSLVERALAERPDDPNFLDTRGTIYLLKKDYQTALGDLEKALVKIQSKGAVHRKLATIYSEMGMKGLALEHRILSGEIDRAESD